MIVKAVPRIDAIAADAWDACANPDAATFNPFLSHAFLDALETSGTVGPGTGWMPHHLVLEGPGGGAPGVMPLYAKTHSQGEYVFDHSWAEALHRVGGSYYPKLQGAVPFTPVPGRRFLARPGPMQRETETLLAAWDLQIGFQQVARLVLSSAFVEGETSLTLRRQIARLLDYPDFPPLSADLARLQHEARAIFIRRIGPVK